MVSHTFLKAWVSYNRRTGVFRWRRNSKNTKKGQRADRRRKSTRNGVVRFYRTVCIKKYKYQAHRLALFYLLKRWPPHGVDHIDGNGENNRYLNIRRATQSQNNANAKRRVDNTSGVKGVSWSDRRKRWCAYINHEGRRLPLGRFKTLAEAKAVRQKAAEKLHGEFARHA